jgi:hypothetical protein
MTIPNTDSPQRPRGQRIDCHRPGAVIPADYGYVFSYNLATRMDGWPLPSLGVNCELDRRRTEKDADGNVRVINGEHNADGQCCIIGLRQVAHATFAAPYGTTGKCSICGTRFIYGDVWRHTGTGEYLHVGHQCADKYALMADRSAWELANGRARAALAVEIEKAQRAEERKAFFADNPGLEEALKGDHHILRDMAQRFEARRYLSPKQVEFALKLADEARNPREDERHVDAPTGRLTFRGTVVSLKARRNKYGIQHKLTVKVHASAGSWLAWGACPAALLRELSDNPRGTEVEITATLKQGRDPHFALMSRPSGCIAQSVGMAHAS